MSSAVPLNRACIREHYTKTIDSIVWHACDVTHLQAEAGGYKSCAGSISRSPRRADTSYVRLLRALLLNERDVTHELRLSISGSYIICF